MSSSPLNEGSSVGVEILRVGENRRHEIAREWRFGPQALIEEFIPGRELTVGVLGSRALTVTDIAASHAFYDYESKYAAGGSRHTLPAVIHAKAFAQAMDYAVARARFARLPRCHPRGFPLRRYRGRARPPRAARSQYAAGADTDVAAARTGCVLRHRIPLPLRLDGGGSPMPRVKKREIARPSRLKLLLRRQRRLFRPLALSLVSFAIGHGRPARRPLGANRRLGRAPAESLCAQRRSPGCSRSSSTAAPIRRSRCCAKRSALPPGDPILGFSVSGARDRIESLSWVEHVAVERRLPGTIFVDLVERRPFGHLAKSGEFLLIDRDGQVVTNEDVAAFGALPLVVGASAPAHAADLLDLLEATPDIRDRVAAAVRVGERRWNLQLKNGITVMLPEGTKLPR